MVEKNAKLFDAIIIELTSDCNRTCWFCNRNGDTKRISKEGSRICEYMPREQIDKIADQLVAMNWKKRVCFNHMSEPTLDDRLHEIAMKFKGLGMETKLNTNGDLMWSDQDLCDKLCESCDIIEVGIYQKEQNEKVNDKVRGWQKRLKNCRNLQFSIAAGGRFQRRFSKDDGEHRCFPHRRCLVPNQLLMIHFDGEVALCCEDINCEFGLGNAFETPIMDIWTSKHRLELVKKLSEKRENHPICAACPIIPT